SSTVCWNSPDRLCRPCSRASRSSVAEAIAKEGSNKASITKRRIRNPCRVIGTAWWARLSNRRRRQHFTLAIVPCLADHASHFHGFHQAGSPVVADLQFALHGGNRSAS